MTRDLPTDSAWLARVLEVIERDILPLTETAVDAGNKIFGAAILKKSDRSLVVAAANHEIDSPLWHGEIVALQRFHEMAPECRPDILDCLFISTHEPCVLCLSAITWSGLDNFYYLFSHEDSRDRFDIPHDVNILKEIFGLGPRGYKADNAYWTGLAIKTLLARLPDGEQPALAARVDAIFERYRRLSYRYQKSKANGRIPLP